MTQAENCDAYRRIQSSLTSITDAQDGPFGEFQLGLYKETTVAIWRNDPSYEAGTFSLGSGESLENFLQKCSQRNTSLIILCLDSAGVSLSAPQNGVIAVANALRRIHQLNMQKNVTTVALLGDQIGCFGGALLIAGACQYRFSSPNAMCGVSGPKVIEAITDKAVNRHFFGPTHRIETGELDGLISESPNLLDTFRNLPPKPLNRESLRKSLNELLKASRHHLQPRNAELPGEDSLPFDALAGRRPMSIEDLVRIAAFLINHDSAEDMRLQGNAVQEFSESNEAVGFSKYLSLLAATMVCLSQSGHSITIEVNGPACGATFIAFSMMATELELVTGADVDALPPAAVEALTGRNTAKVFI